MSQGVVYTVSAPSGAGKTSLVRALLEKMPDVALCVSHTTREQRAGEVDGRDYHFVARETFARMIEADEFVEHAEVFGNLYGTSRGELRARLEAGTDVVLEIDWQGARQVRRHFPAAVSVFVLPPSRDALAQRLLGRGRDSAVVVRERMAGAIREIEHYAESDYLIVNQDFAVALAEFVSIVTAERLRLARQQARHGDLIAALLA